MSLHPRSDWTSTPAANSTRLTPSSVDGTVIHWNGPSVPRSAFTDPRDYLRGVWRYHVEVKKWSDIAYNLAVDQTGDVWVLRGLGHSSAANGDRDTNARYVAVLAIIGQGQAPTPAMLGGLRQAVGMVRDRYPNGRAVLGHVDVRPEPTACPGPDLKRAVERGDLEQEDDDMTTDELIKALLDQLRDTDSPLARNLRNNVRIAVQDELAQERAGQNPGQ